MTRKTSSRWPVLAAAGFLAACATLAPFLAPGKHDRIKAPHAIHEKAQVDCSSCHETIFDSTTLETVDLPKEKKCMECHREERQKGNCAFCHEDAEHPSSYAKRERILRLNHAEHIERTKEDCKVCHKSLPSPYLTDGMAPPMATCFACHNHQEQYDRGECAPCHKDLTRYPLKPVLAFSHKGDFLKEHRLEARSQTALCTTCHEQTFCSDCHAKTVGRRIELLTPERVDRAFIHRNDFVGRHSIEARADEAMCQRCHGTSFCQDCHARRGLNPTAERNLRPHPDGYADPRSTDFHGTDARRDVVSCAACHDQGAASNCVGCHKVGGVGGNPHPPSWLLRHSHEQISRNPMCLVCHL